MKRDRKDLAFDIRWHLDMARTMCQNLLDDIEYWVDNPWYVDSCMNNVIFQIDVTIGCLKLLY